MEMESTSHDILMGPCLISGDYSPTKSLEQLIWDHSFANDAALVALKERAVLHIHSYFTMAAQVFDIKINLKKI